MVQVETSSGRWEVTTTVDLTKVSGLDGASRPSWFVPGSELPAQTPAPSVPAAGGSSPAGSAAP